MKYLNTLLTSRRVLVLMICAVSNFLSVPSTAALQPTASSELQELKKSPIDLIVQVEKFQNQAWVQLLSHSYIQSGDRLRYRIRGHNHKAFPLAQVVVTQPIPKQTHYVLDSATELRSAVVTYSIDDGKTYTTTPMISVKKNHETVQYEKAPASHYTNIRWELPGVIPSQSPIDLSYQVQVR